MSDVYKYIVNVHIYILISWIKINGGNTLRQVGQVSRYQNHSKTQLVEECVHLTIKLNMRMCITRSSKYDSFGSSTNLYEESENNSVFIVPWLLLKMLCRMHRVTCRSILQTNGLQVTRRTQTWQQNTKNALDWTIFIRKIMYQYPTDSDFHMHRLILTYSKK